MKFFFNLCIFLTILGINIVQAGYGIDCEKPTITSTHPYTSTPFSFECKNNTEATFNYFDLKINELDDLERAHVDFYVIWPHGEEDIRPGDVGVVHGTFNFPTAGDYAFDFDKAYGGEEYSGIFCKNGKEDTCVNLSVMRSVYVTDETSSNDGRFFQCRVNPTSGQFQDCNAITGLFDTIATITFQAVAGKHYAYVSSGYFSNGVVNVCAVDLVTGAFSNCETAGYIGGVNPNAIDINFKTYENRLYAYIANGVQNGQFWICEINARNGKFRSCSASGPEFANGVVFFSFQDFGDKTYLYAPNGNYDYPDQPVLQCTISPTGEVSSTCPDSGAGSVFYGPNSITFFTPKSETYAYVSALDTSVFKCTVNTITGQLSSTCHAVLSDVLGPSKVVITQINETNYAYIVVLDYYDGNTYGNGYVEQCEVDGKGDFIKCKDAGPGPIFGQTLGLTFLP